MNLSTLSTHRLRGWTPRNRTTMRVRPPCPPCPPTSGHQDLYALNACSVVIYKIGWTGRTGWTRRTTMRVFSRPPYRVLHGQGGHFLPAGPAPATSLPGCLLSPRAMRHAIGPTMVPRDTLRLRDMTP